MLDLTSEIEKITNKLVTSQYKEWIDESIFPPIPFRGSGEIKLIVLGQDPTVNNPTYREKIKVTLLLNQPGGLRTYLSDICDGFGILSDKNVYATNLLKNFFTRPPDQFRKEKPEFMSEVAQYWIPLLLKEISEFPNIPVITLGEPVLNCLMKKPEWCSMRDYWGYEGPSNYGGAYKFVKPEEDIFDRIIFPFPHLNGLRFGIYKDHLTHYLKFMSTLQSQFFLSDKF